MTLLFLLFAPIWQLAGGGPPTPPVETVLPRPASLEPVIAFWKDVFIRWDEDYVILHDAREPNRIYEVRRLPPDDGTARREREQEALRSRWKEEISDELRALSRPGLVPDRLTGRARRLYLVWEGASPQTFARAARDVRSQRGIRGKFVDGLERSTRYVEDFRAIFREEGVPEGLVYLPHVESSFQWNARSSVGALGMWQFMLPTARRYMKVGEAVDERLDPHTAARAAARYLKEAYARLGSWPLAVISYNYGVDGLAQAVRQMGTNDIEVLIREYEGPLFGFSVRNFYPELLAAAEVADSLIALPGDLTLHAPVPFETFELPAFARVPALVSAFGIPLAVLHDLNPAFSAAALAGDAYLPTGYTLRLPVGGGANAGALFAGLPEKERPLIEPRRTYRVQHGETLSVIAANHRTSVAALQRLNGIRDPRRLRVGTVLRLP